MNLDRPRYGIPLLLGFAVIGLALLALPALCVLAAGVCGP